MTYDQNIESAVPAVATSLALRAGHAALLSYWSGGNLPHETLDHLESITEVVIKAIIEVGLMEAEFDSDESDPIGSIHGSLREFESRSGDFMLLPGAIANDRATFVYERLVDEGIIAGKTVCLDSVLTVDPEDM